MVLEGLKNGPLCAAADPTVSVPATGLKDGGRGLSHEKPGMTHRRMDPHLKTREKMEGDAKNNVRHLEKRNFLQFLQAVYPVSRDCITKKEAPTFG